VIDQPGIVLEKMMDSTLLRLLIATAAAFVGGLLSVIFGRNGSHRLATFVYTAIGALLAVTIFDIFPDAKAFLTWPFFIGSVLSGYLLFWLVARYINPICPACSSPSFDLASSENVGRAAVLLMIALAIHSTMDGLAVVIADDVRHGANLPVVLAISFHKLPEGMALGFFLLGAGYSPRLALLFTCLIETTTLLGGLAGMYALHSVPSIWLGFLFAHVAGGFIYLVVTTLSSFAHSRGQLTKRMLPIEGALMFLIVSCLMIWVKSHAG
jgi:zinc transporter ZupT